MFILNFIDLFLGQIPSLIILGLFFSIVSVIFWLFTLIFKIERGSYLNAFKLNLYSLWPPIAYVIYLDFFGMQFFNPIFELFGFYSFDLPFLIVIFFTPVISAFFINKFYGEEKTKTFVLWLIWLIIICSSLFFILFGFIVLAAGASM